MSESASLADAIAALQEAQARLVQAIDAFTAHNHDENAHQEIWAAIQALKDTDVMWTRAQIKNLIEDVIGSHLNTTLQDGAHPGWEGLVTSQEEWRAGLENQMHELSQKVDAYVEEQQQDETTLAGILQTIENRYAATLNSLQSAYQAAVDANNTQLAESYYSTIRDTINAKRDELLAAMTNYQSNS